MLGQDTVVLRVGQTGIELDIILYSGRDLWLCTVADEMHSDVLLGTGLFEALQLGEDALVVAAGWVVVSLEGKVEMVVVNLLVGLEVDREDGDEDFDGRHVLHLPVVEGVADEKVPDMVGEGDEGDALGVDPGDGMVLEVSLLPAISMMDGAKDVRLLCRVLQKVAQSALESDHINLTSGHHQDVWSL